MTAASGCKHNRSNVVKVEAPAEVQLYAVLSLAAFLSASVESKGNQKVKKAVHRKQHLEDQMDLSVGTFST